MKKGLILLLFLLFSVISFAQNEDAWVYFKNKPSESIFLSSPLKMLSQRSIDRRARYQIPLDDKDVPIETSFVSQISDATGITVLAKSKWLNALHLQGTEENISNLLNLDFVDKIEFANNFLNNSEKRNFTNKLNSHLEKLKIETDYDYGYANNQIDMLKGNVLHENNFTGEGMQIAIIDAGFPNVDNFEAFKRIREQSQILGGYNFVDRNTNVNTRSSHGMSVLSVIAGYLENDFVGTAPDAKFYLFITEDEDNEVPLEESLWVEAAEKADSLGVDVINTSLGYTTFDNANYNYTYNDMDGKTAFISRGAEIAFSRGMIIVNAAGNEGNKSWKYIISPADAKSVLSIGAVNEYGEIASFSSFGPTSDGRIKPDVCARGAGVYIINSSGSIATSNGTSFSSPVLTGVVTCLWQAFPEKSNIEIIQLVKEYSSLYNNPTAQDGFGIPNFESIFNLLSEFEIEITNFSVYPNPLTDELSLRFPSGLGEVQMTIVNTIGQIVTTKIVYRDTPKIDLSFLINGLYLINLSYNNKFESIKILKN